MSDQALPELKYDSAGLIPAVVQDFETGAVLMVAWMNEASVKMTMESGYTHFWSRSRQKFWKKGETSGHLQKVRVLRTDCDADTLLVQVEQTGPACHTNSYSCFFELLQEREGEERGRAEILDAVHRLILDRKSRRPEGSYVAGLLKEGKDAVIAKIVEEAGEVADASRRDAAAEVVAEAADLWFHSLVLLGWHDIAPSEVFRELGRRYGKPGKRPEPDKE
jgi:phosphoribosyl-ATP pyrophosphohydrolase/phosphoribosyl-AMP cyclohydrolase